MIADTCRGTLPVVHRLEDEDTGLRGFIVVHSTALGPAAGGCRLWNYVDDAAALADAMRLAEGMSYKNALAGLPLGGGKAVLMRPSGKFDRQRLLAAFGRAVSRLNGAYVTAEDVGTTVQDMEVVARETSHVAGLPPRPDRPGGDPSPWTARGVFLSMKVAVERRLGRPLSECSVAIQGVGSVGRSLARMLHEQGARLAIADVNAEAAARVAVETGAVVVPVDAVLRSSVDVVAPCALGGVLDERAAQRMQAKVVCGAANNQLASADVEDLLAARGILYAPDYVVNAGGMINAAAEYLGWSERDASSHVEATGTRLSKVLAMADRYGCLPGVAANELAGETMAQGAAAPCPMHDAV